MKVASEIDTAKYLFSELEEGCTYRESLDGPVYMKIQPIEDKYGGKWNAVGVENGNIDYTFEDSYIYYVDGTFVEGYKKG